MIRMASVADAFDDCLEIMTGRGICVAVESQCGQADALDDIESPLPLLGADGLAQDPAKKTDVIAQRRILIRSGSNSAHVVSYKS